MTWRQTILDCFIAGISTNQNVSKMEHLRSQYEELLVLQSMFDRSTELEFDEEDLNLLSDVENHQQSRDNFRFAIHCKVC